MPYDDGPSESSLELKENRCFKRNIVILTHGFFPSVAGNTKVTFYEINSIYGHDSFLIDLNNVGAAVKVRRLS